MGLGLSVLDIFNFSNSSIIAGILLKLALSASNVLVALKAAAGWNMGTMNLGTAVLFSLHLNTWPWSRLILAPGKK